MKTVEKMEQELASLRAAGRRIKELEVISANRLKAFEESEFERKRDLWRIATLEAKLAEAVEVFRWLNRHRGLGFDVHERISIAIQDASEVMG